MRLGRRLAVVVIITTAAAGCGEGGEPDVRLAQKNSSLTAADWVTNQQGIGDGDYSDPPLNFRQAWRAADVVLLGTIDAVERGRGYYVAGDDAVAGTPTTFDADRASWRSVHGVITVERELRGRVDGSTVKVGFTVGGHDPFDPVAQGVRSLGRAVFFLYDSPVYDYQPGLYGALFNGSLVATVDGQERLHLPLMTRSWRHQFKVRTWTLERLEALAAGR
jgi:hypothetical protein